jgi:LysM repeat protein
VKQQTMTTYMMVRSSIAIRTLAVLGGCLLAAPVWSQKYPVTPAQTATAQQVAQAGVALSDLAPNAPDSYVIKRGDTLWAISSMFLRSPWRWPELWGMNLEQIRNPHLIYPGQQLVLDKTSGRAILRNASDTGTPPATGTTAPAAAAAASAPAGAGGAGSRPATDGGSDEAGMETIRLSPRTRYEPYGGPLTTLKTGTIEAFLAEPLIVEENELATAPRIVATQEGRVMLSRGDRAYVRGPISAPVMDDKKTTQYFRVFGNAKPLKDPDTGELLGYEAQFVGKAALARSEMIEDAMGPDGKLQTSLVPATIDIVESKDEILVGYRLLPVPERQFLNYVPHAPTGTVDGRIVSLYGSNVVANASQSQVVVISRGRRDGMEPGHVMAILKNGPRMIDRTDASLPQIKLPNERNGLLMVFKTFEKVSYGLILDITEGVKVGDRLATPQ